MLKPFKQLSILIIDDHALMRAGMRCLLTDLSGVAELFEASNGLKAIQLVKKIKPAIVLLDVNMPEMDGITIAKK